MPYQILKVNYRVTSKKQSKKFFVYLKLLNNARVLLMFTCLHVCLMGKYKLHSNVTVAFFP